MANQKKNNLLYYVSVLCSGRTGRIPEMMGSVLESQTARQRLWFALTSGFDPESRHRACPSFRNLGTFDLVDG